MASTMAGITTGYSDNERPLSLREEASVMARYLPLIISAIAVAVLSVLFYHHGNEAFADKWIAAELFISITIALVSAAIHTHVWTVRNAGVIWLMVGTLMLYGGIGAELWNLASGIDSVLLAIMRGSLLVSGPMMVYGVIEYNRHPTKWEYDTGYAAGVVQEQHDQYEREAGNV